ncbi:MAG: hypothetical protein J6D42_11515 [Clostridia bacterium]|nr:hypothetical protein [Clostridia bacterium]
MNNVSQITVCRDHYASEEEFYEAMKTIIKFLINEDYIITVKNDCGPDIIVIEYEYSDLDLASRYNFWLTADEADIIDDLRAERLRPKDE